MKFVGFLNWHCCQNLDRDHQIMMHLGLMKLRGKQQEPQQNLVYIIYLHLILKIKCIEWLLRHLPLLMGYNKGMKSKARLKVNPWRILQLKLIFQITQVQYEVVMEDMITFKTSTPLYKGSSMNMLAAMLLLLNLRTIHGVCNVFMDELFSFLHKELLPKGNNMPINNYEAFN